MTFEYRIFPAIRRGFRPSRMTSNNLISPMKFCYNTNSTLPKQCQSSRSVLQDGSRTFGLFWKEKTPSYNRRNTVIFCVLLRKVDGKAKAILADVDKRSVQVSRDIPMSFHYFYKGRQLMTSSLLPKTKLYFQNRVYT